VFLVNRFLGYKISFLLYCVIIMEFFVYIIGYLDYCSFGLITCFLRIIPPCDVLPVSYLFREHLGDRIFRSLYFIYLLFTLSCYFSLFTFTFQYFLFTFSLSEISLRIYFSVVSPDNDWVLSVFQS
jgi:hypothetical protein